jgi:formamidopyrimidine-DNA glycosylase
MPELPEVEAARRGLDEQFVGRSVAGQRLMLPKLVVSPAGLDVDALVGQPLEAVRRHGKYLTLRFPDVSAVMHLKLSGQLVGRGAAIPGFAAGHPVPAYDAPLPHKSTHLILSFDDGSELFLTDIRHFARLYLMPPDVWPAYMAGLRLGPDAISPAFTRAWFHQALGRRAGARLKPLLLDQTFLAGLGNIYVDESLHRARLHPERLAGSLSPAEIDRLYDAVVEVLDIAVPIGGARILNGKAALPHGAFPFAHGRAGQPCLTCGTPLIKEWVNNRGTYRCPSCQPAP